MHFEGSEKKLEIFLKNPKFSARKDPFLQWDKLLNICHASILKSNHYKDVSEYLLSESSLFVYDDQIIIITCGQTPLYKLTSVLVKNWSLEEIVYVFYSRKNFFFPHKQLSYFEKEIKSLTKVFPEKNCKNYRFGSANREHLHVFLTAFNKLERSDMTLELLMQEIPESILELFRFEKKIVSVQSLRSFFSLNTIFNDMAINDHCFQNRGYSFNGIMPDQKYCTIHVSPEKDSSYISFETNAILENSFKIVIHMLEKCKPSKAMIILFSNKKNCMESFFPNYTTLEENFCTTDDYLISVIQLKKMSFIPHKKDEKKHEKLEIL